MIFGMVFFCLLAWEYNHKDVSYDGLNRFIQGIYCDAFYSAAGTNKILQSEIATQSYAAGLDAGNVKLTGDQTIAGTKTFSSAIAGSITGNAATVTAANEATDTTCFPLFATAATGSLGVKTNANLTYNSSTGQYGIGTTTPEATLDVVGANLPVNRVTRTTSATNTVAGTQVLRHTTSSDMADGFGAGVLFQIRDSAAVDNNIAIIGGFRDGADNSGGMAFQTYIAGSVGERMRLSSSGNLGVGVTAPSSILHLKAGTATASTAPLKLTSGTLMTNPEAGAIEYDGTSFYCTNSTLTRSAIGTMNNPMTTAEDIIVGGTSGTPARKAKGADGTFLGVVGGAITWTTPAGAGDTIAPATTTENKVPFWSSVSKTLSDGWATATTAIANTLVLRDANANITAARFYGEADSPKSDYQLANKKYVDDNIGGLPSQTGNSGKYLTTNGSAASWATVTASNPTMTTIAALSQALARNSVNANIGATGSYSPTLPTADLVSGDKVKVSNVVGAGKNLTVTPDGSHKIFPNGAGIAQTLTQKGQSVEYTWDGVDTWIPAVSLPTVSGEWVLVKRMEVVASGAVDTDLVDQVDGAQTSYTFSNLDGNSDRRYQLRGRIINGYNGELGVNAWINADETTTNYTSDRLSIVGTTVGAVASQENSNVLYVSAISLFGIFKAEIEAKTGTYRAVNADFYNYSSTASARYHFIRLTYWEDSSTNISSILVKGDQTGGFGVGSYVDLYKAAQ